MESLDEFIAKYTCPPPPPSPFDDPSSSSSPSSFGSFGSSPTSSHPPSNFGAPAPSSNYGSPPPSSYGAPPPSNYGAPAPSNYGAPSPSPYGGMPSPYGTMPSPFSSTASSSPQSRPGSYFPSSQPPPAAARAMAPALDVTLIPGTPPPNLDMTLIPNQQPAQGIAQIRLVSKDPQFFPTLTRDPKKLLKVGRLMGPEMENDPTFIPYNTKVVSRIHAEIWENQGEIFIKDIKSKSGTFLNTLRLSPSEQESKPFKIKDGDVIQFGVDFQGSQIRDHKAVMVTVQVIGGGAKPSGPGVVGIGLSLNNLTMVGGNGGSAYAK